MTDVSTDLLEGLRASCEYDPEGESSVDALIDYKNALEDLFYNVEHDLCTLILQATAVRDADDEKWERLACGQDTEEAEASGALAGQEAALHAALKLVRGDGESARACLDLEIDP